MCIERFRVMTIKRMSYIHVQRSFRFVRETT